MSVIFKAHDTTPAELAALLATEREGQPFLAYRDGDGAQRLVHLEGERVSVGREPSNAVALEWDPEASRLHALFERLGGSWTVLDDGISRNGTLVNGARVNGRRRLHDGDVIRIGATRVLFRDPGEASDETAPAAGSTVAPGVTAAQRRVLLALCRPLLEAPASAHSPPSNAEIATDLSLSVEAVRTHLKTLFRLFEVPDLPQSRKRAELARRAIVAGVVRPGDLGA